MIPMNVFFIFIKNIFSASFDFDCYYCWVLTLISTLHLNPKLHYYYYCWYYFYDISQSSVHYNLGKGTFDNLLTLGYTGTLIVNFVRDWSVKSSVVFSLVPRNQQTWWPPDVFFWVLKFMDCRKLFQSTKKLFQILQSLKQFRTQVEMLIYILICHKVYKSYRVSCKVWPTI